MTVQKEIQQTPVTFHKMCDEHDIDDVEINSVFQENSSRQLFRVSNKQTPVFCAPHKSDIVYPIIPIDLNFQQHHAISPGLN